MSSSSPTTAPKTPFTCSSSPSRSTETSTSTPPEVLTLLSQTAKLVAEKLGLTDHYRIQINNGYGQEVAHIHFHFMSDRGADRLTFLPQ